MRQFLARQRVFLVILGAGLLVYAAFVQWGGSLDALLAHGTLQSLAVTLAALGYVGHALFVVVSALLCAMGMPRLLVSAAAGLGFGVAWGIALSQLAVMLGAYLTFAVARWSGSAFFLHRWPRLGQVLDTLEDHGIVSIFLIRQLPVSGFVANIVLGLSAVKQWQFLVGSFIGFLPEGVPAVFVGAGVQSGNLVTLMQLFVAGVLLLVCLSWMVRTWLLHRPAPHAAAHPWQERALMLACGVVGAALCAYTLWSPAAGPAG